MAVTAWGQVYIQASMPQEDPVQVGSIWVDTANSLIKVCTAVSPYTFAALGSGGDVDGPGSATDNALARFDGTTGKLLQNSGVTVDDSNNLIVPGTVTGQGFGAHEFSAGGVGTQILRVRNTTAGAGNSSMLTLGNDAVAAVMEMRATSSTYTAAGAIPQDGVNINVSRAGGLSLQAEHASGTIRFYTGGGTERARFESTGVLNLLTGQLKFPASQAASADANTLDDCERGTFTPAIGGSGGQSGQVYAAQSGQYVKIGQIVVVAFRLLLSTEGTITGNVRITGLPFTSHASHPVMALTLGYENLATNWVSIVASVGAGTTDVSLTGLAAAASGNLATNLTAADISNTTDFRCGFAYRAAE